MPAPLSTPIVAARGEQPAPDGPRPKDPLDPRPKRGIGSWPLIIAGAAMTIAGGLMTIITAPCDSSRFHFAVELAGSDARLRGWLADSCPADLSDARASLAWDVLLILGYALLLRGILRRWWPLYEATKLKAVERQIVMLPVIAAALDLAENLLIYFILDTDQGRFSYPDSMFLPVLVSTCSWLKWILLAASFVAAVMAVMLAIARRGEKVRPRTAAPTMAGVVSDANSRPAPEPAELGVCCSGGGIRAAAFSIGALESLEDAHVMDDARWLSAVSGGAYAATAWTLLRAESRPPAEHRCAHEIIGWLQGRITGTKTRRHRFLRNGPGGLGRPIVAAVTYIGFNLLVLGALVYTLAWPLGWVMGSWAIQPALRTGGQLPDDLSIPAELWLPGIILLVAAAVVLAISCLPSYKLPTLWRWAMVLIGAGVVLELLLVVAPLAMVLVGRWFHGGTAGLRATALGGSALIGVATTAWGLARPTVVGHLRPRLPKLGGLLLVAAALIWGGKVATDAATNSGSFRSPIVWAVVAVVFLLVYGFVGTTQLSIHRIYRKRLRRSFGLRRIDGVLTDADQETQLKWTDLEAGARPELILCCAQQRTGIAPGGLPADTFTISRSEVRMGDVTVPTDDYVATLNKGLKYEPYVSSWIATTGAAFASAMGRLSKGSTNALMAALNIDLGIWLPNPRLVAERTDVRFPRVRLGYLFKEVLGWYDPSDRYVFVADGGHWENLGLVELLRRRCATIICLDASGDTAGTFATLNQAVELAGLELPDVVESIDLTGLKRIGSKADVPATASVAKLKVVYCGTGDRTSRTGTILYAKAQLSSDLDIALRRYAKADRRFPNYSTGNQFLTDEQFANLVNLGRAAGRSIATTYAQPAGVVIADRGPGARS